MIAAAQLAAGDRVLLAGQAGQLKASVVRVFTRGDTRPVADKASSEAALTIRGMALQVLHSPGVERAALVVSTFTPLFLVQREGSWYDVQGNPVVVIPVE